VWVYTFKHALAQEVAYHSVLSEWRKRPHERAGAAIEALSGVKDRSSRSSTPESLTFTAASQSELEDCRQREVARPQGHVAEAGMARYARGISFR
jgi:hypothetical protein